MGKEQPAKLQITNVSCFFSMDIYMQFLEYVINVVPEYFIVSSKININNFFWQYRVIEIIRKKPLLINSEPRLDTNLLVEVVKKLLSCQIFRRCVKN